MSMSLDRFVADLVHQPPEQDADARRQALAALWAEGHPHRPVRQRRADDPAVRPEQRTIREELHDHD
jgi:hypothetical protein